jgi:hypothetical protein
LSLIVTRHFQCRFAEFILLTHLLDLGRLFLELIRQCLNLFLLVCVPHLQILHSFVSFKKLIEQHRVHLIVANKVGFSFLVARHQIGIYFFHIFGQEAALRSALGIDLFLVAEGHRFQRQDRFARLLHGLDRSFEPCRRSSDAELPISAYHHLEASHRDASNASDKCRILRAGYANADFVGLARNTLNVVADVDVVTIRGEISPGVIPKCGIPAAACVVFKRVITVGRVLEADCVARERTNTGGAVVEAGRVASESINTSGVVVEAGCVIKKRRIPVGRVVVAGCVASERRMTIGRVVVASCVGKERTSPIGRVFVAGCVAKERTNAGGVVVVAGCVAKERISSGGVVFFAGCVVMKRINTIGRVIVAGVLLKSALVPTTVLKPPVVLKKQGKRSGSRVFGPGAVVKKRCRASGRILICRIGEQRPSANCCVEAVGGVALERKPTNRSIETASR